MWYKIFFWDIARLYFVCKCKNCRSRDMIEWNKRCVKNVGQYLNILSTNTNYTILYVCFSSLTKVVNHLTSTLQCRINFIFVTLCIFDFCLTNISFLHVLFCPLFFLLLHLVTVNKNMSQGVQLIRCSIYIYIVLFNHFIDSSQYIFWNFL